MHRFQILLLGLLAIATLCSSAMAQTFRGGINGTVTDVQGAFIANAGVTATNADTAVAHSTTTSSGGEFLFQDLHLGTDTIT